MFLGGLYRIFSVGRGFVEVVKRIGSDGRGISRELG